MLSLKGSEGIPYQNVSLQNWRLSMNSVVNIAWHSQWNAGIMSRKFFSKLNLLTSGFKRFLELLQLGKILFGIHSHPLLYSRPFFFFFKEHSAC